MALNISVIANQYKHRKTRELQSEAQLANFLKDSVGEVLLDYQGKRRAIASSIIDTIQALKEAQIQVDTYLDLTEMQKLGFAHSAKTKDGLIKALNDAKTYQECCSIAQEARNRGLEDVATNASNKAEMVGPKGFMSNQSYLEGVKNVRRAVTYLNSNFIIQDPEAVMSISQPTLIPVADVFASAMGGELDESDQRILKQVSSVPLGDCLSSAQRKILENLDK